MENIIYSVRIAVKIKCDNIVPAHSRCSMKNKNFSFLDSRNVLFSREDKWFRNKEEYNLSGL